MARTKDPKKGKVNVEWRAPLLRILDGYDDLLRETSTFPNLGKLPPLGRVSDLEKINVDPDSFAGAGAAIVVVVVCVAVAARPGGMINEDFLRAKLLDSLLPRERRALREAIELVRGNPDIVKGSLGIAHTELGPNFMGNLEIVAKVLD